MLPWWYVLIVLRFWPMDAPPDVWSYDNPTGWNGTFPLCNGPLQSPVALTSSRTVVSFPAKVAPAEGLVKGKVTATNSGRHLVMRVRPQNRTVAAFQIKSYKKPLFGVYDLQEIHLHWGDANGTHGSEHAIEGRFAQAEAQLVFFNKFYKNFGKAKRSPGGLAIISFLLNGAPQPMAEDAFPTLGLEKHLAQVAAAGSHVSFEADLTPLQTLINDAVRQFYSYYGSLTSPPCSPVVTWMVATQERKVDAELLNLLTTTMYQDAAKMQPLVNNWRPLQEQKGRVIVKQLAHDFTKLIS